MNVINWFVPITHSFVNSVHGKDRKVWHFKFTWLSNELVPVVEDSFTKLEIMCCSNHEKRIQRIKKDENSSSGGI